MSPHYDFHVFICQNQRPDGHQRGCCASKNSVALLNYMKARVKELGLQNIRINKSGCLDQCEKGPAMVIYPDSTWYNPKTIDDMEEIIQKHIVEKNKVTRLYL